MPPIRVFLADDHAVLRAGLKALLTAQADMDVVGEAGDGLEALREAERIRPDVVLADVGMPGLTGLELTRRLKESLPEARVLILTARAQTRRRSVPARGASAAPDRPGLQQRPSRRGPGHQRQDRRKPSGSDRRETRPAQPGRARPLRLGEGAARVAGR